MGAGTNHGPRDWIQEREPNMIENSRCESYGQLLEGCLVGSTRMSCALSRCPSRSWTPESAVCGRGGDACMGGAWRRPAGRKSWKESADGGLTGERGMRWSV